MVWYGIVPGPGIAWYFKYDLATVELVSYNLCSIAVSVARSWLLSVQPQQHCDLSPLGWLRGGPGDLAD